MSITGGWREKSAARLPYNDSWRSFGVASTPYLDTWPTTWSKARRTDAEARYAKLPEKLYTKTSLPVVTPDNCLAWLRGHGNGAVLDVPVLQEYMTSSAQLSLLLYAKGFRAGFPVDHRYGWDLGETITEHFWTRFT